MSQERVLPDEYTVCVIIPTYQRRPYIEESLGYLLKSSFPHERLEVFISDGGSDDGSEEAVKALQEGTDIRLRWYSDKDLRVSAARTYAINHTTADLVLFLDDDCLTQPGWIDALASPLVSGEVDITAGTDEAPSNDPFLARCEDVAFRSLIGSGGVRGGAKGLSVGFCPMSCNMALRRDTMLKLGAFDEALRFVEDTDFVYKARAHGCRVKFVPEATVLHRRRATVRQVCHHNYVRGYGRAFLNKRYPGQRHWAMVLPAVALLAAVGLLGAGFAYEPTWCLLSLGAGLYALLLAITAVQGLMKTGHPAALVVVPFLVAMHHLWYAIGLLHAPLTGYRKVFALDRVDIADPFGTRSKG